MAGGMPCLLDRKDRIGQEASGHMEALFRFPTFYRLKHDLLRHLNKTEDLDLTEFLSRRSVLDVGCGPFSYGFDTDLPASLVGLDLSSEFVRAMAAKDPESLYIVSSAKNIPFADNTFDTALLRFVIHHIPGDTAELLREVARVTRRHIVIFDHVRSDVPWKRFVQMAYWNAFDSGHHYHSVEEWEALMRPYRVMASNRSGLMFGNVCKIVLDLDIDTGPNHARRSLFGRQH